MLDGGQSHVDAWDFKEHAWTPKEFDAREIQPGVKWPMALYPKLAKLMDKHKRQLRSVEAWDSVHYRAQYYAGRPIRSIRRCRKRFRRWHRGRHGACEAAAFQRSIRSAAVCRAERDAEPGGLVEVGVPAGSYSPFHVDTSTSLSAYALGENDKKDFMTVGVAEEL